MQPPHPGKPTAQSPPEPAQTAAFAPQLPVVADAAEPPAHLENLAAAAKEFAKHASAANTQTAYAKDWRHFTGWCRRRGLEPLPPAPQVLGLYITDCAAPEAKGGKPLAVATIERKLSGPMRNFRQRGFALERSDRHIASVLAGIRRKHGKPPVQKEAILPDDIVAMVDSLGHDLRGLRDRAILLLGFAGGLRRSEIVGLNVSRADIEIEGCGWIAIEPAGVLLTLRGKTGWREVEIARGSSDRTCPVAALEAWLKFGRIERGPIFRPILKDNKTVDVERLSDKHVANLVKRTALAAGLRGELPEAERALQFAGHSLRAGLASSAEVDERYVQKQLGHASAEMTRRYQRRRDRFRINLTKAAGL